MIIDSHAHIFPYLGGRAGYDSVSDHLDACQRGMHEHLVQPVRRRRDNEPVQEETLWDPQDPTLEGKYEVDFRAGKHGRFEWTHQGVDYYIQYFPPWMSEMRATPGWLSTQMDQAGVDKAVLQCGSTYGRLNEYYARTLGENEQWADRFLPLARVRAENAHHPQEITRLERAIRDGGLTGLWFAPPEDHFDDPPEPFWNRVEDLAIPVFWVLFPDPGVFNDQLRRLGGWMRDHPGVPCVIPQSFPLSPYEAEDELRIPGDVERIVRKSNLYLELAYPIGRGAVEEYPFPTSRRAVRTLYETFGPSRLVWGSDAPMVERYCTYEQSLRYLKDHCSFIPEQDMKQILGGNLKRIFDLDDEG